MSSLVFASKSAWLPAIRREHALATEALADNLAVTFVESPRDVRSFRSAPQAFVGGLRGITSHPEEQDLTVIRRSTIVPGHRHRLFGEVDNALLARVLRPFSGDALSTTVGMLPWQWSGVYRASSGLRVFDAADNWAKLIPHRSAEMLKCYERIADEADHVIVASPLLAPLFRGRKVFVVPNGATSSAIRATASAAPGSQRMIYVGTMSERFDDQLVAQVLGLLPDWHLDLYGQCRYQSTGERPSPGLTSLLNRYPQRATWHGVVPRAEAAKAIDLADVALIPNHSEIGEGQSSMKVFDYASRGRPIVTTPLETGLGELPPATYVATTAEEFSAAVVAAASEDPMLSSERLAWVRQHSWKHRWSVWRSVGIAHSA